MGRTLAQRLFDTGEVALPDDRPPGVDAHAWRLLVRHVREGASFHALGRELGVSEAAVRQLVAKTVERLRAPELLPLPVPLRRALVAGGYTTRAAVASASDAQLLALPGIGAAALWRLRSGLYDAPRDPAARFAYYRAYHLAHQPRPAPEPQARGDLPPAGALIADDDGARVQCHVCGRFYAGLALHVRNGHGLSGDAYRERYGLARGQSLYAPAYQEKMRAAALARDQGAVGRAVLREAGVPGRRPGRDNRLSTRIISSRNRRGPRSGDGQSGGGGR